MPDLASCVALFGAGVASFLAPCVVPLVPAYVGMMVGEVTAPAGSVVRAGATFVAGFASIFVALGVLAGQLGSGLASFQSVVQRVGGIVIIILGSLLLLAGRRILGAEWRLISNVSASGGIARPFLMGIAFGAGWTPCVGPLLGAALVVAADAGDASSGGVLLGAYALGIGAPFVATALALASWPSLVGGLQRLSHRVEPIAGVVLIALGVLLVTGTYDRAISMLA